MSSKENTSSKLEDNIPAILLVGGMGTRLRTVLPSKPKPLAPIGKVPLLQLLVQQLRAHGIHRLVMCTGHLADQIQEEFGDGLRWGVTIHYSKESRPLGTAGAVKLAGGLLAQVSDFLVLNGDSFLEVDFRELIRFHREYGGMITMAVCRVPDSARFGTVQLDGDNRVVGFSEKTGTHVPGVINGGVYVFRSGILEQIPEGASSLETDLFPHLLDHGVYAVEQHGVFIDIGTPEDYARAQALSESLHRAVHAESQVEAGDRQPR